jgi:hypothetical protein
MSGGGYRRIPLPEVKAGARRTDTAGVVDDGRERSADQRRAVAGGALLQLQRSVGNRAVMALLARAPGTATTVQRHSNSALKSQFVEEDEAAEAAADATVVQRRSIHPLQRHPMASNTEWVHPPSYGTRKIAEATRIATDQAFVAKIKTAAEHLADQVLDAGEIPAKKLAIAGMSYRMERWTPTDYNPAQTDASGIRVWIGHPNYYKPDGSVRVDFLRSTLLHEAMHFVSSNHQGFQGVDKFLDKGEANDTLDEAVTEKLSHELASSVLGQNDIYTTNYWNLQARRGLDFHLTLAGLERLATGQAGLWLGKMVDVIIEKTGLTWESIRKAFLSDTAAGGNAAVRATVESKRAEIAAAWKDKREAALKAQLGAGAIPKAEWQQAVMNATAAALSELGAPPAAPTRNQIRDAVNVKLATATPGHEIVSKSDPRSSSLDDWKQLAETAVANRIDKAHANSWLRSGIKELTGWKNDVIPDLLLADHVRRANVVLGGVLKRFPMSWVIVPPGSGIVGSTPFKDYPRLARTLVAPQLLSKSMSELTGIGATKDVHALVEAEMGGGAYEANGDLAIVNLEHVSFGVVLHEMGHHKQKHSAGLSEENVSLVAGAFPLLDLHNIILHENLLAEEDLRKGNPDPVIRLRYTETPTSLPLSVWRREAANHSVLSGNFATLEKRLKMKGGAPLQALTEIRAALTTKPLYTGLENLFLNLMVREMKAKHSLLEATDSAN